MSESRLITRAEMAEVLGYNKKYFSQMMSKNRHIFKKQTQRGSAYMYTRNDAIRVAHFFTWKRYSHPVPKHLEHTEEYFARAAVAAKAEAKLVVRKLNKLNRHDKIRAS